MDKSEAVPRPIFRRMLSYDVPLNACMSQLVLPRDLTLYETEKLCAVIRSLLIEDRAK